ncbi:endolytic transglycosylase MltG [Candidatus Margulisiibacteriota bacterium]
MTKNKIVLAVMIGAGLLLLVVLAGLFQCANLFDRTEVDVTVPMGISTFRIQAILEEHKVIRRNSGFAIIARALGYGKHFQAGKYRFAPSDPLLKVLIKLKAGDVYVPLPPRIWVTFPEGASIYVMGEILKKNGVKDYKKFQDLTKEGITATLRKSHWELFKYMPTESLEGYLYPDTYWFFKDAPLEDLVEVMIRRFEKVVLPFWQKAQKDTKYNLFEIITLASIIEKEAQVSAERRMISSVYHNRLDLNIFLAACPTIKYALKWPTKKVYYEQLEVDSPYNTYKNKGLPPGPICNPGIESIKAAVYPLDTDYCYFVARQDGSHIFSKTGVEHQRAKERLQKLK